MTATPSAPEASATDASFAPSEILRRGPRLFATPGDEPRARRATDLVVGVGAVATLVLTSLAAVPAPGFAAAVADLIAAFPSFLDGLWQFLADSLVLLAILLVVAALVRRRLPVARDLVLAATTAVLVSLLVARVVDGSWPDVWDSLRAAEPPARYPSARVAVPAAVVMTAAPHLTRPMRRLGKWLQALAALGAVALASTSPLGAVAGLLVAAVAASTVHLAFGSSGGRPGLRQVATALAELGVPTSSVGAAERQQAGPFLVHAVGADGAPLVAKVYGRDAHDAALVSTLWRSVWYREAGTPLRFGRLQQVEHEAFLTLLARQAGVRTDEVVTAGASGDDDAILVLRRSATPLAGLDDADPRATARALWALVRRLHLAGIAHGQLDEDHLVRDGGELGVVDFRGATAAASVAQRRTDEAQAFVTTILLAGEADAVEIARDALGTDGLGAMLPYVQSPALTPAQRRRVREADVDLDGVRARSAEAASVVAPPLQQLRRITIGSVVRVVLPAFAVLALMSGLAGLDLDELIDALADATWWLVALGFVVTQLPRVTQSLSTIGASPVPLPLGPVYGLQLATSYVNLAVPTTAARVAINIRFFQRHGVPPGSAIAAGALDGFSGFVVQATLLVLLLLFSPVSLDVDVGTAAAGSGRLLIGVALIAIAAFGVVLAVARWRRFVLGWARRLSAEALETLRGLRSPRRLALLFGGNLASEVLFAVSLGVFTQALGYHVALEELLLINISVALLAGLLPIPGGIGVAEGGLTWGLVRAGVPEEAAFAAVMLYRLASFYLPPIWGFFAMRWLEKHEHL